LRKIVIFGYTLQFCLGSCYHIWDKKRRQKRRVKKATGKKSDLFLIFRGKIRHFVFFAIFDFFFWRSRFFLPCTAFFTESLFLPSCSLFLLDCQKRCVDVGFHCLSVPFRMSRFFLHSFFRKYEHGIKKNSKESF